MMETRHLNCNCSDPAHLIRFSWWENEDYPGWDEFMIDVQLSHYLPWYKRIWQALKYIFSKGHCGWSDTLLLEDQVIELQNILTDYFKRNKDK